MAQVTAALVKELRERTGAGMSDCKKALDATEGDINKAAEKLRMDGSAKADKKAARTAAEGVAVGSDAVALVELNSETDFVAKGEDFRGLATLAAQLVLKHKPATVEALGALADGGESVDQQRRNLVAKIGEKIELRRFELVKKGGGELVTYVHPGDKIAVVIAMDKGPAELGKDLAMHVAAMSPRYLDASAVPADAIEAERKVIDATIAKEEAEAQADGKKAKPAEILAKMADGKIRKFVGEITLLGQPFVKSTEGQSVESLLKAQNAALKGFIRYAVGDGIEKAKADFAAEVAAAAKG